MPKQISPLESFVCERLSELELTEDAFLHRLGYRRMHTGRQHLEQLYLGDRSRRLLIQKLPEALELPPSLVRKVLFPETDGPERPKKNILNPEQYHARRKAFFESLGPNPAVTMIGSMSWCKSREKEFHQTLRAENTWFESEVSDDYIALRDTISVQAFLSGEPYFISLGAFNALANEAISQAFGEPTHIFDLHANSKDKFYARHRETLGRILIQRGIIIQDE